MEAVDFSVPYYETAGVFMANTQREISKWAALMRPYRNNVWLLIALAVILAGPVFWWLAHRRHKGMSLSKCYEISYQIFINQGN